MERVGLVVLSIVAATALVVGASYGAMWLQPLLLQIPAIWMIGTAMLLVTLGAALNRRRRRTRS